MASNGGEEASRAQTDDAEHPSREEERQKVDIHAMRKGEENRAIDECHVGGEATGHYTAIEQFFHKGDDEADKGRDNANLPTLKEFEIRYDGLVLGRRKHRKDNGGAEEHHDKEPDEAARGTVGAREPRFDGGGAIGKNKGENDGEEHQGQ